MQVCAGPGHRCPRARVHPVAKRHPNCWPLRPTTPIRRVVVASPDLPGERRTSRRGGRKRRCVVVWSLPTPPRISYPPLRVRFSPYAPPGCYNPLSEGRKPMRAGEEARGWRRGHSRAPACGRPPAGRIPSPTLCNHA
jgi:hypothetical protein